MGESARDFGSPRDGIGKKVDGEAGSEGKDLKSDADNEVEHKEGDRGGEEKEGEVMDFLACWRLLFGWWLDLTDQLRGQKGRGDEKGAYGVGSPSIFSPTGDEMEDESGGEVKGERERDGEREREMRGNDARLTALINLLSPPTLSSALPSIPFSLSPTHPHPRSNHPSSALFSTPFAFLISSLIMEHGGVLPPKTHSETDPNNDPYDPYEASSMSMSDRLANIDMAYSNAPISYSSFNASLDLIRISSEAVQDHGKKNPQHLPPRADRAIKRDNLGASSAPNEGSERDERDTLMRSVSEKLMLMYLNVATGWCSAVKGAMEGNGAYFSDGSDNVDAEMGGADGLESIVRDGNAGDKGTEKRSAMGGWGKDRGQHGESDSVLCVRSMDRMLALLTHSPLSGWMGTTRYSRYKVRVHLRSVISCFSVDMSLYSFSHTYTYLLIYSLPACTTYLTSFSSINITATVRRKLFPDRRAATTMRTRVTRILVVRGGETPTPTM